MTRWLMLLSVVALSAGAMQVRAQHTPTIDGAPTCSDGSGQLCRIQTVRRCENWVSTSGSGGISPTPTVKITYECERWVSNEKKYYYTT